MRLDELRGKLSYQELLLGGAALLTSKVARMKAEGRNPGGIPGFHFVSSGLQILSGAMR